MRPLRSKNNEVATGSGGWRSKTLIAAYCVLILGIWQAVHVAGGGEIPFKGKVKSQVGSTKLHADREAQSRKNRSSREPVAAFFERAKRGMTEQEIRGMIADYEAMGPMPSRADVAYSRDYAKKLNDWYTGALIEGLSLTSKQRRAVRTSLDNSLDQSFEALKAASLQNNRIEVMNLIHQMTLSRSLYFQRPDVVPWNICDLTEGQLKLTYQQSLQAKYEARRKQEMEAGSLNMSCHTIYLLAMHVPESGEYMDYPPPSAMDLACSIHGSVSGGMINVTNTFPLTPDQKLENHRNDLLAQAKLLHPAQLRLALLMNAGVAETIRHQLDKPRE